MMLHTTWYIPFIVCCCITHIETAFTPSQQSTYTSWRSYIDSFLAVSNAKTTLDSLIEALKLTYLTTNRQFERHMITDSTWNSSSKRPLTRVPPFGKRELSMSLDSGVDIEHFIEYCITVDPVFYINVTFTKLRLFTFVSGCDGENLTVTHYNKETLQQDVYCGHLPQWTQLIANNTVTITYTSSLPQLMCTGDHRKPLIHFTYQVIHMYMIDKSHTDVPYRLNVMEIMGLGAKEHQRLTMTMRKTQHFVITSVYPAGLQAISERLADISQIWFSLKVNYDQVATIIARSRDIVLKKDLQVRNVNMVYYDGPHYRGFPPIEVKKYFQHVFASSMSITLKMFGDINLLPASEYTDVLLIFYGHRKTGIPYSKLSLTEDELDVNVWLTADHKACRTLQPVMMLCALQVTTKEGRFLQASLQNYSGDMFDHASCVYKGVVLYEMLKSYERHSRPSHIHKIIPRTVLCKEIIAKNIIYKSESLTLGKASKQEEQRPCFFEQTLPNRFVSSTDSIMIMFYRYTPEGFGMQDISVHLKVSVVTCQGLTLPCSVISSQLEKNPTRKDSLANYATWVSL